MQTPLEIINLTKEYNGKNAVKNISFNLNQNEIIGILGPNGCGNIGMILGLLNHQLVNINQWNEIKVKLLKI